MHKMNELEQMFNQKNKINHKIEVIPDSQYRIFVTLIRSDRPKYWNFLCINCGTKVVELQNMDVISLDDFYDPQNVNNQAVGRHCKGYFKKSGLPCQHTYFFHLS